MAGPGGREVGRVSVRVLPDTSLFVRSLKRYLDRVEKTLRVQIPVTLDAKGIVGDARRITKVAKAAAGKVEIPVKYDKNALTNLKKQLTILDKIPKSGLRGRTQLFIGLGVAAAAATPNILSLTASLAAVSGVVAALPAVAGGAIVGVGALAVAFSGVGKALKSVFSGKAKPEDLAKSLKSLTPAAKSFVLAFTQVRDEITKVRKITQETFFKGLDLQVKGLANQYLPLLGAAFAGVAKQANLTVLQISNFARLPKTVSDVKTGLNNVVAGFSNLRGAATPLSQAIRDIGVVGSTFLPAFGRAAASAAINFTALVSRARETGKLQEFIAGGVVALKQLGQVGLSVAKIIGGVFQAANGGATLGTLAAGLSRIADIVNGPAFQVGLTAFFTAIRSGADSVLSALPALGSALVAIQPAVSILVQLIGNSLGTALSTIFTVVESLSPSLTVFSRIIGQLLLGAVQALSPILLAVGQALNTILLPVFQALQPLIPQIVLAFTLLGQSISNSITGNLPALNQLGFALGQLLVSALKAVLPLIPILTPLLLSMFQGFIRNVPAIISIVNALAQFIAFMAPVIAAITRFIVNVQIMKASSISLVQIFLGIVKTAFNAVQVQASSLANGVRLLSNSFSKSLNTMSNLSRQWRGIVFSAFTSIGNAGNRLKAILISAITGAANNLARAFSSIVQGARSLSSSLTAVFSGLPSRILSVFSGLPGQMLAVGRNIVNGLVNGIRSGIGAAASAAASVAAAAVRAAKATLKINSPSLVFSEMGENVVDSFSNRIEAGKSRVGKVFANLVSPPKTTSFSSSASSEVGNSAGRQIVFNGNVGWSPDEVARRINIRDRDNAALLGLAGAV